MGSQANSTCRPKVGVLEVITTFGDDEFNELSYASLVDGLISSELNDYFVAQ